MNNDRRKEIQRISQLLDQLQSDIGHVIDSEQDSFDNLPESMQAGDKGSAMEAAIEALGEAKDFVDQAIDALGTAAE